MSSKSALPPILTTKFQIPQARARLVTRSRLLNRLDAGAEGKLILIAAPAGYGKTTLVADWLTDLQSKAPALAPGANISKSGSSSGERPIGNQQSKIQNQVAWLSLDEGDNDPKRFLLYVIGALKQVHPEIGKGTGPLLRSPQSPPDEIILTSLVNEISAASRPLIFVLDDYHSIHTPAIHKQLTFLLDHQPAQMLLVILTREDPLLPIPRLRAGNQVLEIRQGDLRFTSEEAADFLHQVMELDISAEEVAALERRTEGWIAGLQLAALSMQGHADPRAFIQSFTGSSRYILDYLIEEVFERQTPEIKDFLLKTSILEQLSAPLCDAVLKEEDGKTGQEPSSARTHSSAFLLEYLEQANLFFIPLDQSRSWYRYHHLFVELLRHHARTTEIPLAALHQRASRWYESQGLLQEAVEHSLAAQDWGNAARLIGTASGTLLPEGEFITLLRWFGRLPPPVVASNGNLCMVHAWAAMMAGQFEAAAPLLEHADRMAESNSHFLGQVASAQAFFWRSKRDNAKTIEKSEQALSLLPESDAMTRGIIAMNLGLAYWHEGLIAEAEAALTQACEVCQRSGNRYALETAQIFLARVAAVRGKLRQAASMCQNLIAAGGDGFVHCHPHFDLAAIHLEWGDLPGAQEHFEIGFALARRSGNVELIQAGFLQQAILAHARGQENEAAAALAEADALAHDFPAVVRSRTAAFGVQMALARKDELGLAGWEPRVKADVDSHSFYRFMGLTRPRLMLARGDKEQAARTLKTIYEKASRSGWGYGKIVVRILQSMAAKNMDEAAALLAEAFQMGQPEGFLRSFVEAGPELIPILHQAARRGIQPGYASRILSALGAGPGGGTQGLPGLAEPLSEREVEVLRLIMAGLSNREIAERLVISPGTAKTHIHNLCGKLGVHNRTEAAMWAKEYGLD